MPSRLILLLGGARSGKSALAERLAARLAGAGGVLYVATAQAGDDEMRARIAEHQRRRPASWRTLEAPLRPRRRHPRARRRRERRPRRLPHRLDVQPAAARGRRRRDADAGAGVGRAGAVADLLAACRATSATCLLISNEVGLGLVPPYPLGRAYRDLLGRINQRVAAAADEVYLLVAGIPVDLKALASPALLALLAEEPSETRQA